MINIKISSGLAELQREMRSRLNSDGIRKMANTMANRMSQIAVEDAKRQLAIDAPGYAPYAGLLVARQSRSGVSSIQLNRAANRKFSALLAAQAFGARFRIPSADIDSYVIRVDRRFGYRRIHNLLRAARAGTLESSPGASPKVYVSPRIGDKNYALVQIPGSGIYLFERFGRYQTVRTSGGRSRGQRNSRLIAFLPYSITIQPKWRLQEAVDRSVQRNEQRVFDQAFTQVARNRRYRAR